MSSAVGLKICAIATGIKKFKSIIKKKRNYHNEAALLAKTKLNGIEVLISKALIDSFISQDEGKNLRVANKKRGKPMFLSKCAVYDGKKSRFIKEQEARGLLLRANSPLDKIPILGAIF